MQMNATNNRLYIIRLVYILNVNKLENSMFNVNINIAGITILNLNLM